ncbi:glutamine--fructose-6-phosphate transaminase (isomerizing) [Methanobrevibacter olleyae]|uniref:Glutamine--fructose-6-phosphate aminotransferase [isomerizing] n=1 Tax=Methanobrevibacter olleyae TaxID=294671 RepID=A0A126R0H5_METOL|nr:glutamine--fructose-6-phosphate transaminase (isomerizing) [Methanobrevibacter olleyae]AMK15578.1 glucosamine-fructose-6-phosphate aminotransferase GlmS [Methanobrevibacter olleyae]SFL82050.1 glucosamine--fructose-6-phosphate aminotransferase (isomerizing) [Methanobrevibacter olleyae]
MCGIVGCVLKNDKVAPILLDSISKLEYRGYDSVGLATAFDGKINLKKDEGQIKKVDDKLNLADMPGNYGIAHVRWATHGDPSRENSHPHLNSSCTIAVVHNGIIENYLAIKEDLQAEGYEFKSGTDTEVIPHLLDKFIGEGLDLEKAVRKVIGVIEGAYAIAAICVDEPNKVVATRKDSPLIVGIGEDEYFVASDSPAILKYTNNIAYLEEGEIVILTEDGVTFKDANDKVMKKDIDVLDWSPEMAEKEGYDHFMIKEINEQDAAIRNTLGEKDKIKDIVDEVKETINRVVFVACGTSYHASLTGKYLIESLVGIPTEVLLASEFKYSAKALNDQTLVIFISQSGETADTLKALDAANETSKTLAIVNVRGSSATRKADYVIQTQAGPEIGVAATKTYVSQLIAIYLFSALLADDADLLKRLEKVPDYIDEVLKKQGIIREISNNYKRDKDAFFIGRGFSYPIALEGALKLKEISYIHAEGYAAGELKHGPIALIDKNIPVVVVVPPGQDHNKIMSNLQEVKARGADVLGIGAIGDKDLIKESDNVFLINSEVDDILAPLVYIVPLQLLSYHVSVLRELDPDKPKNLAKCVTVE